MEGKSKLDYLSIFILIILRHLQKKLLPARGGHEYLFTVTGVKKMKWFLSLRRCYFQSRLTEGYEWLVMDPSEK